MTTTVSPEPPPKRRTKVAVLVGALEVGGAELDIVRNVPRLDRDEFEVVVVSFGEPGTLAPELERQGIRVIARLDGATTEASPAAAAEAARAMSGPAGWIRRRIGTLARMARAIPWIGRTFNAESVDIAHFYLPYAYGYGMFACLLMRRKTKRVMSRLSLNFYRGSNRILSWLERHLFHRYVDIAIANSEPIVRELVDEGVDPSRVRLLHNGIDPAPFASAATERPGARRDLGIKEDTFVILAVGNLHTYKGHADLIEACEQARGRLPEPWLLLIAGRDEAGNSAAYEALIEELGLGGHVRLLGPSDDVPRLLAGAEVFVQPSHHEGLPNAVLEAMASSLPVIGTAVGGIPEAVVPAGSAGETGWLVPPHDPAALAEALFEAGDDTARRRTMGEHARSRIVAEFSLDKSVAAYESIYRELMR
jgi:glycosyltransferase involved in cell wall biosynthesis